MNFEFEKATEQAKNLPQKPSDEHMLQLYGLYKQATMGDINITRPSFWDMVGKAKWDSWKAHEGISCEDAKIRYIKLVEYLSLPEL